MKTMLENPWVDLRDKLEQTDLAIIPVGASEVYGPHIPNGTDGLAATALARSVAEQVPALVTPLIPVGYSQRLMDFPGTLSVSAAALKAYLEGVVESLRAHGVRRVLFINGHAGNVFPISELLQELRDRHTMRGAQVDVWRFIQPLAKDLLESEAYPFGHAGEAMTSVMLHLHPELMHMDRAVKNLPAGKAFPDIITVEPYGAMSDSGVLGDATLGTAEKGKIIFEKSVERLVAFIESGEFSTLE